MSCGSLKIDECSTILIIFYGNNVILNCALTYFKVIAHIYDEVMALKCNPHYWSFFRGNHWLPANSIQKEPVMWNFGIFFIVSFQQSVANTHNLFTSWFIVKSGFYLSLHHRPQRIYSCPYANMISCLHRINAYTGTTMVCEAIYCPHTWSWWLLQGLCSQLMKGICRQ